MTIKIKDEQGNERILKVGFTCGSFDLFHVGHILMLEEARKHCDYLIVGCQSDPTIDRPNKNKPIQSLNERVIQLAACRFVDEVVVYDTEQDLYGLLQKINPDVRIIGEDWKGINFTGYDLPIPVVFNSRQHNFSSSELRQRIIDAA